MSDNALTESKFDPVGVAKRLLRETRTGALATLDREDGAPFATLVTVATDLDGSPLLLVSRLSAHTSNLDADPRASLLLAATGRGDPLAHPRITIVGRVEDALEPRVRRRFLARHPKAELYADFPDFSFRRLRPESAHLNGGFARAARLAPPAFLTDLTGAEEFEALEEGAVDHMNSDHAEAVQLYATRLAGAPEASWRVSGIDPDGIDMAAGDQTCRVTFSERVLTGRQLRQVLIQLAAEARARS